MLIRNKRRLCVNNKSEAADVAPVVLRFNYEALTSSSKQGCPQDVKSQDRDETETVNLQDRDETKTFQKTYRDRSVAV